MGGNIFNTTAPIKKEHIAPTLKKFYEHLGILFPGARKYFKDIRPLGSVYKKDYSGDIDLALSGDVFKKIEDWGLDKKEVTEFFLKFKTRSKTATDKQLIKRAIITSMARKIEGANTDIDVDEKGSGAGALFLAFPQYDEKGEKLHVGVQIDINIGDVKWLEFAYHSATYKGNVKGLHRTQLMISLFANKGYTFSHNYGVKNKQTQEIEADTPRKAIKLLSTLYNTEFDNTVLGDYFKLMEKLRKDLSEQDLANVLDTYLKILDSTRADIPEDLQKYWISRQSELGLKGKFLPDESKLTPYKAV